MAENQDSQRAALDLLRDNSMALSHELSGGASKAIEAETIAAYDLLLVALTPKPTRMAGAFNLLREHARTRRGLKP